MSFNQFVSVIQVNSVALVRILSYIQKLIQANRSNLFELK